MRFKHGENKKLKPPAPESSAPCESSSPAAGESATAVAERGGTLVHHGIHAGTYPIAGLTVAQARRLLSFMNIAPDAVAVIGGEIVADEASRVVDESVELLSFVQKSSVKGAA